MPRYDNHLLETSSGEAIRQTIEIDVPRDHSCEGSREMEKNLRVVAWYLGLEECLSGVASENKQDRFQELREQDRRP